MQLFLRPGTALSFDIHNTWCIHLITLLCKWYSNGNWNIMKSHCKLMSQSQADSKSSAFLHCLYDWSLCHTQCHSDRWTAQPRQPEYPYVLASPAPSHRNSCFAILMKSRKGKPSWNKRKEGQVYLLCCIAGLLLSYSTWMKHLLMFLTRSVSQVHSCHFI